MEKTLIFIGFNFLSLVPIIFWLFFFLWQDRKHPEPFKWLLRVYLSGFLMGPIIWLLETFLFKNVVLFDSTQIMQRSLWLCFGGAIIEESIKFLMVYLIIKRNTFCDEYLDPSIYLVTGALGFASLENLVAVFSFAVNKTNYLDLLGLLGGRFLGANFLHALLAVIIGVAWGWGVKHHYSSHKLTKLIFWGLSIAVVIHTIFNYSLIVFRENLIIPLGGFLFMLAIIFLWLFQALEGRSEHLENNDFYR
jgi:RsiW-degrading membrane proteinase PrsW (M82 family)